MKTVALAAVAVGTLLSGAGADKEQAITKDRQAIVGTWKAVSMTLDGKSVSDQDAEKVVVVNRADGTWTLTVDGKELGKGNSQIDPTKKPRTIDFTFTEGPEQGKSFVGIYELDGKTRKLCFVGAGKERPSAFASEPGSGSILLTFKREKP